MLIVAFFVARMYGAFAVITQVAVLHLTVTLSRHCYATNLCEWACSWRALMFCNIVYRKDFCECIFILVFQYIYVCCIVCNCVSLYWYFPAGVSPGLGRIWTGGRWWSKSAGSMVFHLLCQTPFGIFALCRLNCKEGHNCNIIFSLCVKKNLS